MMKKILYFALFATVLISVACTAKTQQFQAADGSVTATVNVGGNNWKITDAQGMEPVADYDSMRVTEVGEDGHPMTVVYYRGNEQHVRQYYSNMQLRCEGMTVNGLREGRWVFYHSNGNIQSECTYVLGLEEGPYRVMRENGAPYYIGEYSGGKPTGTWEIYDPQGNFVGIFNYFSCSSRWPSMP